MDVTMNNVGEQIGKKLNTMENKQQISFIEFIPVSLFGSVMGLCALCFAWRRAALYWNFTELPALTIGFLAIAAFIAVGSCYALKWIKYPKEAIAEFKNPATVCFFATLCICLLLLPGVFLSYLPLLATIMWCVGAVLMFFFAWYIFRSWVDHRQDPAQAMPFWVMPIVGLLDLPVVGHQLNLPGIREISVIAFGIGSLSAVILITIILSRLFFQPAMPSAIQPSLLILTAPMALAFTVYHQLSGNFDILSSVFFYFNMFLLLVLGSKISLILYACPFKVSWWSVSFPLSAITICALTYAEFRTDWLHQVLAGSLLTLVTLIIFFLLFITIYRVIKGTFA